jgi:hypothetical protein
VECGAGALPGRRRAPARLTPRSAGWQYGPTRTSRAFAIRHLAVVDAVAAITGAIQR